MVCWGIPKMECDLQAFGSDVDPPCLRKNSRHSLKGKTNSPRSPTARSTSQEGALSHSPSNQSQQGKFDWAKKFCFVRDHFSPSLPAINLLSLSSQPKIIEKEEKEEKETSRNAVASTSSSVDIDSGLSTLKSKGLSEIRSPTAQGDVDNKKAPSFPCSGSRENLSIKAEIELVEKAAESMFPECPDQKTPSFYFHEPKGTAGDEGGPSSEMLGLAQEPDNIKAEKDRGPDSDDLEQRAIKAEYLQDEAMLNQNDTGEDCSSCGEREFPKCGIIKERADEETDVNSTGVSRVSDNDERETDAQDSNVKSLEDVDVIHSKTFCYLDANMAPSASTDETVTTTFLKEEKLSDAKSLLPPGTFKGVLPENRVPGNTRLICAIRSDSSQHQLISPQKETISCNVDEQSHGDIKQQDNIYTRKPVHAIVDSLNSCCDKSSVWDSNSVSAKSTQGKITSCNNTETNTEDIKSQAESEALRKNTKRRRLSRIPKLIQPSKITSDITLEKSIPKPSLLSKSGVREPPHDESKSHPVLSPSKKSCAQTEMTHRVHVVTRQSIRDITRSDTTISNPSFVPDTFTVVRDKRNPSRPRRPAIPPLKRSAATIKFHSAENFISRNNSPEASQWANSPKTPTQLGQPRNSLSFIPMSHSSLKPKVSFASDMESNQQPVKMKLKLNTKTVQKPATNKTTVLLEQPEDSQANHDQGGQEWSETHHKTDFHKVSSGHRQGSRLPRRTVTDPNLPRRTGTTGFGFSGKTQISVQHSSEVNIKSIMKKNNHNASNVLCPKQGKNSYTCDVGVNENTNSIQKPEKTHADDIIYQHLLSPQMFSGGLKFPKTFKLGSNKLPPNSQEARQFCKTISRLTTEKSSASPGCFSQAPMPLFCTHLYKSNFTGQKSEIVLDCKNIEESSKNLNKCGLIASRLNTNLVIQQSHSENCAGSFVDCVMSTNQASLHPQQEKEDYI